MKNLKSYLEKKYQVSVVFESGVNSIHLSPEMRAAALELQFTGFTRIILCYSKGAGIPRLICATDCQTCYLSLYEELDNDNHSKR